MESTDIIVVGGGFAGMCAARALADGRRRIVVLEALRGPAQAFRGELMHPLAADGLDRLGLLEPLRRAGGLPVEGFAVSVEGGVDPVVLPYAEITGAPTPGLVISHPDMVICLRREVAGKDGVELRSGERVSDLIHEDGAVRGVRLAGGEEVRAPLTIVCDGRHSRLRGAVGAAEEKRLLSFTAALLTEPVALPRPGYGHVFIGAWGPILAYAVGGSRVRLCIDIPVELGKSPDTVALFIRESCAPSVPEPLRAAMLRALAEGPLELAATHAITTRRCTSPGVALVGDAGGCAHPLTAGGMTIALNDVTTLAEELGRGDAAAAGLERYQERRYAFVRAREIVVEGLYNLFRRNDEGARAMRRGLSRYWSTSARARGASLSLLSGRESRVSAFLVEYLAVLRASARGTRGGVAAGQLARTSLEHLGRTAHLVYLDLRRRPTLRAGLFTGRAMPPTRSASSP